MEQYKYIYAGLPILSLLILALYMRFYTKAHGFYYIAFGLIATFNNMNYFLLSTSSTADAIYNIHLNTYALTVLIPVITMGLTYDVCKVQNKLLRRGPVIISSLLAIIVMTTKETGLFYRSFTFDTATGILTPVLGPAYVLYYAYLMASFAVAIVILLASKNRNNISAKCYQYVIAISVVMLLSPIITAFVPGHFDFDSVILVLVQLLMLFLCRWIPLYDIETVICETLDNSRQTGIILLDGQYRLLGYNKTIENYFPEFLTFKLDRVPSDFVHFPLLEKLIRQCKVSVAHDAETLAHNDRFFSVEADFLLMNGRKCGYQITLSDITVQQQYLELVQGFNTQLESEVDRKAQLIAAMQDNVILGIAELVEDRDNSTGGHIKRTSQVVSILAEELEKRNTFSVSPNFYMFIIKAAKMHDLGKIAVADSILRKPGKFTPEEYEQMKQHAAKGGVTVSKVLENLNASEFVMIATNIAHYHHERWDGRGYPEQLTGEEIPLEARIMAVADVYDALVSKRCYKDEFDFSKAYDIVVSGMGTQFDPQLKECFCACVPKLEAYYRSERGE